MGLGLVGYERVLIAQIDAALDLEHEANKDEEHELVRCPPPRRAVALLLLVRMPEHGRKPSRSRITHCHTNAARTPHEHATPTRTH